MAQGKIWTESAGDYNWTIGRTRIYGAGGKIIYLCAYSFDATLNFNGRSYTRSHSRRFETERDCIKYYNQKIKELRKRFANK